MIYFHFLGRQTGKTTKAIEIFNRDVDNMLIVPNADLKQKIINVIRKDKNFNSKHDYLLDRKVKSMYENIRGYRCNNLIIDEPMETNLDFTGFNNSFNDKLRELSWAVQKDIIILQSIDNFKLLEYIEITDRIIKIYQITNGKQPTTPTEKDITEIVENIHHQLTMINVLSDDVLENEIISLIEFKKKVFKLIKLLPFHLNIEIITNKLPE